MAKAVDSDYLILLVEDQFLFVEALKRAGARNPVRTVQNGREAIDYLSGMFFYADRERFPFPKILFLDLKLPGMSGWEVLEWVRANHEFTGMLVIVLTSSEMVPQAR